jgi:hypothetical protein
MPWHMTQKKIDARLELRYAPLRKASKLLKNRNMRAPDIWIVGAPSLASKVQVAFLGALTHAGESKVHLIRFSTAKLSLSLINSGCS